MLTTILLATTLVATQATPSTEQSVPQKSPPQTCAAVAQLLGLESVVGGYTDLVYDTLVKQGMSDKDAAVQTIMLFGYEIGRIETLMKVGVMNKSDLTDIMFGQCDWEV